jgi:hypothetical protein
MFNFSVLLKNGFYRSIDIMTYLVVLSYPEKLWSENLKTEMSPRYTAMKKHLDHAVRIQLYANPNTPYTSCANQL